MGVRGVAGAVCLGALALGLLGCGGSGSTTRSLQVGVPSALGSCRIPVGHGTYDQPRLHNSGISCSEALAIALLVARGMEEPQEIDGPQGPPWFCRSRPAAALPVVLRCSQGQRFFTIDRVRKP